jgi:hypothetical protein
MTSEREFRKLAGRKRCFVFLEAKQKYYFNERRVLLFGGNG